MIGRIAPVVGQPAGVLQELAHRDREPAVAEQRACPRVQIDLAPGSEQHERGGNHRFRDAVDHVLGVDIAGLPGTVPGGYQGRAGQPGTAGDLIQACAAMPSAELGG